MKTVFKTAIAGWHIELQQSPTRFDNFAVVYGQQMDRDLHYADACAKLGQAIMHALACDGRIDNRTAPEARAVGDGSPVLGGEPAALSWERLDV